MPAIMAKLTKRLIDALKPRRDSDLFVWDGEQRRFPELASPGPLRVR
jgi:hypothetical protein